MDIDAQTLIIGRQKLKRNLQRSLANLRLSKRGSPTLADKNKIKKVAVNTLQRYLKNELDRTRAKTYDWYFFKDGEVTLQIEAIRNNLLQNRYFIVDHAHLPILSLNNFGSTYGRRRVQEFDITCKQIGEIISSSAKQFADMMKITVSAKEDAKIWKAYDAIDEKKIITVTIALPAAIIAAAEAVPLMVMASKSSIFSAMTSSLGGAFTVNMGRQMAFNGGLELGSKYLSGGIANNNWDASNIDIFDVASSSIFGHGGDVFLRSTSDSTCENGYRSTSIEEFSQNIVGCVTFKGSKAFGNSMEIPLEKFSGKSGKATNFGGQFIIQTTVEPSRRKAE
ncbi:hypothetical protein RQM65_07360 [Pricia sp. S334]|uniref:DUF4225 domain-containing protein n=1 Tax=Pricia mediterranea TaxID=3076079 RepID=A0ABU3L406_9FLAO|nr:hypothetical protein [Pricia sp. S334]MDT7828475.1 hypothetical protein [Pricia sp. S334]